MDLINTDKKSKVVVVKYNAENLLIDSLEGNKKQRHFHPRKRRKVIEKQKREPIKTDANLTIFLNQNGKNASLSTPKKRRFPLFVSDIIYLLIRSYFGTSSPVLPRWCFVNATFKVKHVVILVIQGMDSGNFSSSCYPFLSKWFGHCQLEILLPQQYGAKLPRELSLLPVLVSNARKYGTQCYGLKDFLRRHEARTRVFKALFPTDSDMVTKSNSRWKKDQFPRTELLLSPGEMAEYNYPLLLEGICKKRFSDYVFTKDVYGKVSDQSPMFALDCEMCLTSAQVLELTEFALVDEKLRCVFQSLVKPKNEIIGLNKNKFADVKVTLKDIQDFLREFLPPDAILVGHHLSSDLNILKMLHPYIIDTSIMFNLSGDVNKRPQLGVLAQMFLGDSIQNEGQGHSAEQDSVAAMKLVKLKLSKSFGFGSAVLSALDKPLHSHNPPYKDNSASSFQNRTAIVGRERVAKRYRKHINKANLSETDDCTENEEANTVREDVVYVSAESNQDVISETCRVMPNHEVVISHLCADANSDRHIDVDRYCQRVWNGAEASTLFTVLFSGSSDSVTGSAFIAAKDCSNNVNR